MDDDVDAYLKRAASLQHSHFGTRGFVVATPTAEVAGQSRGAPVMINTSSSTRVPTLPMKRKRSRQDDAAPSPPQQQQQQQQQPNKEPAATVSDAPRATVSLLDKWFPGITLKEATLAPSQAPSTAYVNAIVSAMTVLRERMIALRSDVEDVDGILRASASEDDHDDVANLVTSANWEGVRDVLVPLPRAGPLRTLAATRRAAAGFMTMKRDVLVKMDRPWTVNAHAWHVFLDANGPETDKAPTLSVFAWMSSASTVTLFTVLVQRLLRRWKIAASGADGGEGQTKGQHDLLCFLRLLMPCQASTSSSASSSCGYGVWLFHCLAMLDIPLDADTDRLVHELFRTLCDQVRVMGEWRASVGDERGALTNSFTLMALNATSRKSYDDMSQIDRVDVCALHSLVVVLAKFFRQNQNRLIPL